MDKPKTHHWNTRKGKNKKHTPVIYERADTYGTRRWKLLRRYVLSREPLCRHCALQDETVLATEVDHIIPHAGTSDPLYWDLENLQPLCKADHSRKTMRETHQKIKDKKAARRNTSWLVHFQNPPTHLPFIADIPCLNCRLFFGNPTFHIAIGGIRKNFEKSQKFSTFRGRNPKAKRTIFLPCGKSPAILNVE